MHVYLYDTLNYCMIMCVNRGKSLTFSSRPLFLPEAHHGSIPVFGCKYNIDCFYLLILRKSLSTVHSVIDMFYVHHKQPLTLLILFCSKILENRKYCFLRNISLTNEYNIFFTNCFNNE